MTTAGWINLVVSVGSVTALFVWCVYRVLTAPKPPGDLAHVEPVDDKDADRR